jgi:hypothetical protein
MNQKNMVLRIFGYLVICALMVFTVQAVQQPVNLGTAGNFVILAKTGISTTGTTSIVGNIGVSPIAATAITGFGLILDRSGQFSTSSRVVGKVYAANYAVPTPSVMSTAIGDMQTAYTNAAGRTLPDYTELGTGNIGGMTLKPGLYKWSSGVIIPADVTLSGGPNDVWVFQIAQNLVVSSGKKVILSGGAQAKNVFWQVAGQTTLGTTSVFNGNILSKTLIAMNTGATLNGKALAQTAVTLIANHVNDVAASRVLTTIKVTPLTANIAVGHTLQLTARGYDQLGILMPATILFTTSNLPVAKVNSLGRVTAIRVGTAKITASSGAVKGYSTITVNRRG